MSAEKSRPGANEAAQNTLVDNDYYTTHEPILIEEHVEELRRSGVSKGFALDSGVYSAQTPDELPEAVRWVGRSPAALPALVFLMTEPDDSATCQVKPARDSIVVDGRPLKYVSPKGDASPQLPVVRSVSNPDMVLIVEGVKQALAVAEAAPAGWAVYRICGIRGWLRDGVPTPHLGVVRNREVVIVPDSDASRNSAVYDGAESLGEMCVKRHAASVRFVRVPAAGTAGIDDVLGRESESNRGAYLQDLVDDATEKPADKRPTRRGSAACATGELDDSRVRVDITQDRLDVYEQLVGALKNRDGVDVFRHGDGFAFLDRIEGLPVLRIVTDGVLNTLVMRTAFTCKPSQQGVVPAVPDQPMMKSVKEAYSKFQRIDGVSLAPLLAPDGEIVAHKGFNVATHHWVELAPELEGLDVPPDPSSDEVAAAVSLIRDELLGDFVFESESDRTHAIAALLTPMVRPLCPTAPMMQVDGLQKGVGKGKLIDSFSMILQGRPVDVTPFPSADDELRKTLTSMLFRGDTMAFFDEAHAISSPALCGFLTAENWSDRKLGSTRQLDLPNRSTVFIAGNNQQLEGDIVRRVLRIRLTSAGPRPEDRTGFRHELPSWAGRHRRELLRALLVLVRAWVVAGRPQESKSALRFGSFEVWQDVVGGILDVAGIGHFLEGLADYRASADVTETYWAAHFDWLEDCIAKGTLQSAFLAKDVVRAAAPDPDAELPPGVPDNLDARGLGKVYASKGVQYHGTRRLIGVGRGTGGAIRWQIDGSVSRLTAPSTGTGKSSAAPARSLPSMTASASPVIEEIDA